jgi:hypothetical protein
MGKSSDGGVRPPSATLQCRVMMGRDRTASRSLTSVDCASASPKYTRLRSRQGKQQLHLGDQRGCTQRPRFLRRPGEPDFQRLVVQGNVHRLLQHVSLFLI